MERLNLIVSGQVQGVGFRYYCRDFARKLGITGFVRNRPDGKVEVTAEGRRENVEKLIDWCYEGSPAAKIDSVDFEWEKATGEFAEFEIFSA